VTVVLLLVLLCEPERYLATGRQYGNTLLGVCHQEEEEVKTSIYNVYYCGRTIGINSLYNYSQYQL